MKICIIYVILLSLIQPCRGAEFKNLDFQSPNVRRITERFGLVRDVIPGWRLQIAEQDQDWMFYNNTCFICPSAQLQGPEVPGVGDTFTFSIKSGLLLDGSGNMATASIYQVGEVPSTAKSLQFQAGLGFQTTISDLQVFLGGQLLPLVELGTPWSYGADVASLAGTTKELRFSINPGAYLDGSWVQLADIQFSSTPVPAIPEPSTWALLATGLAALGWATRNSKQRPAN